MMTGDGLLELRRRTTLVRGINPRGARHWGAASRRQTSHEGSWCQASICIVAHCLRASPLVLFLLRSTSSPMWPCGVVDGALASSKRSDKSTGCWPRTPSVARERVFRSRLRHYGDGIVPLLRSVARAHFIDCGFDARRTSHPVAVPKDGWHHNPSFARSSGSGGRVHTVCRHITATVCDGPPARIQRG